jgi:anti-sigma-K factor RskA
VSAGVIRLDEKGEAKLTFKPAEPVAATKFAISVEKQGGVPQKSADGPVIFVGVP